MIILIILIQGHYGTRNLKKNFAVMQNVTWAEAFDICSNNFTKGRLFRKSKFIPHLMHDRIILKQKYKWDYSDIWIGFMSSGYSPWLITKHTSCSEANSIKDVLPPLIKQSAQCLVLNMSDTSYDDACYATPCSEHRAFLCQSQDRIGKASTKRYNDMIVMESTLMKYVPIKQTDYNTTEEICRDDLILNTSNALAFASVYFENNRTCITYYLEKLIWYPVRIEMVNHSQAVSFVKSTGHKVEAWPNASFPIPGINTYSDNCFNYGLPTARTSSGDNHVISSVSKTEKSMTTHVDYSYSTDSTDNYKTSFSNLFSSVSNKPSFKFSSKSPTIRSATETPITNTEHPSTVYDKTVTEITDTAIISAITTEKSTQGPVSIVSTSKASDRIPNEFCLCPCSSTKKPSNEPFSINNLRLNKKTLSSYRRTLTSATDQRFSVLLIGWSGVFVLVMAVLMIIIPDILTLVKVIRKRKSKSKVAGIS